MKVKVVEDLTKGGGENKIKEEQNDSNEETLPPSKLRGFLECKKVEDKGCGTYMILLL